MLRRVLRWPDGFIAAFLLVQLLLPLHYYVAGGDPHDERFAWRMFSPVRMAECRMAMTADGAPVTPLREFQEAWVETAKRGRRGVVRAMAAHLCRKHKDVTAELTCTGIVSKDSRPPPPPGTSPYAWLRSEPYTIGGSFNLCVVSDL